MIRVDVGTNPNCAGTGGEMVFSALGEPRRLAAIRATVDGRDALCDIVGVGEGGRWESAYAVKVADSGEGTAFLIFGGAWGIRLRPRGSAAEPWSFESSRQWGEAYKVYGSADDLVFA